MPDDHYDTLGVDENADEDEIKNAYRHKAQHGHPDKGGDLGEFKTLQHAYDVLSDPDRKHRYDNGEDVTNRTQTLDEKAATVLARVFTAHLGEAKSDVDFNISVRTDLGANLNRLDGEVNKAEHAIKQAKILQRRMTYKGTGTDLFHSLMDQRIAGATQAIEKMSEDGKVLQRALELLNDYEYKVKLQATGVSTQYATYATYRNTTT